MRILTFIFIQFINITIVSCYSNKLFTLSYLSRQRGVACTYSNDSTLGSYSRPLPPETNQKVRDIMADFEKVVDDSLFRKMTTTEDGSIDKGTTAVMVYPPVLNQFPSGQYMRAETFNNKSSVHLPLLEYLHGEFCFLNVTGDYMQTAVDAFAILVTGDIEDAKRLPPDYVLASARSIAMLKLSREKLALMWTIVKGNTELKDITLEVLERFRPLFKYVPAYDMSQLNLLDDKILMYIGTHPDLNRHQVGVVASQFIQIHPNWTSAKCLNMMNNLLCGVPMTLMRRIPQNTYLQFTHSLFYHIRACDPLQRKFYLGMMTKTQALGKPFSWGARDVSRLGLLLAEVKGQELSAIDPRAMAGVTVQVMQEMPIETLSYLTDKQLRYLEPEVFNVLGRKVKDYRREYIASTSQLILENILFVVLNVGLLSLLT